MAAWQDAMSKRKSRIQVWAEYLPVMLAFEVLSLLPRRAALSVAMAFAKTAFLLIGNLKKVGMRNLEIAFPEMAEPERLKILKGSIQNLGRVLGEMSQFHKLSPADVEKLVEYSDPNTMRVFVETRSEHRGVLITTGHLGNWEMLVYSFAALVQPMSYLARPLDNPLIEDLTVSIRTLLGNRPINKKNSAMLAAKLLRSGEILGILADVNTTRKEGVFVPVFGVPACTSTGAAKLAIRSNALIYPTFCMWDHDREGYKIVHAGPFEPVNTGDRDRDVYETTAQFTLAIEDIIRQYPDQWMWIHKRWKTRPEGEPDIYAEKSRDS